MAKTGERAFGFVEDMTERTRPYWERDLSELREHAAGLGIHELAPWDTAFVSESLRRAKFDIDDETIRPYFPLHRVLDGMFEVVRRVFGLVVREEKISEIWHPDVHYYQLCREDDGTLLGFFYADWHPRSDKRQGAWMNDLRTGGPRNGGFEPHVGIIAGNLSPPKGDVPSLLTHTEVETIFHEFGHLLHHLTSTVPIAPMAGINVAWDFVELPSQIMQNWTWEKEALSLFSGHHETGEPLPEDLYERLRSARTFMGGWRQMRQLSLGHLDLRLHRDPPDAVTKDLMSYIEGLFKEYTPSAVFARMHSTTSFTHLFSGGYAAAYYSYLWSEVLDADAFGRFRTEGIFNREVGEAYLGAILTRGDSAEPEDLFREFMGRDPDLQPLLDRNFGKPLEVPSSAPSGP
jgi:oligopeptidase A